MTLIKYVTGVSKDLTQEIPDDAAEKIIQAGMAVRVEPTLGDFASKSRSPELEKQTGGKNMGFELEVEETKRIDEGKHEGTITRVERREANKGGRTFVYADVWVLEKKEGVELKVGYPAKLTREGSLGKLLKRFGADVDVGKKIDIPALLLNKRCTFVTVNQETDAGTFARIQRESLKPVS